MSNIPLGKTDYYRSVPREARIRLKNRFFENNPVLNDFNGSLISRPGVRYFAALGAGPVRLVYSAPGAFESSAWAVSGSYLYRITTGGVSSNVGQTTLFPTGLPTATATGFIGDGPEAVPEYLYVTDSGNLWVYAESGFARGTLTLSANVANNDTVTIDAIVYKFTSGSVDAGTPEGSVANPWLVAVGADAETSITNLFNAINETGTPGLYSEVLEKNGTVTAYSRTAATLLVRALSPGTAGNASATTEASATASWGAATLAGGGTANLTQVPLPEDVGALAVAYLNSYVIVVPLQNNQINGRFYWINPGETTIDALDFATTERSPDAINAAVVFGDKIWFMGDATTEPWYTSGDPDAPFIRFQGVLFDRGSLGQTALQVKDSLFTAAPDGGVFQISGGIKRVSTPDIEERIRLAIAAEAA